MLNAMIDLPCRLLMHMLTLPIDSSFPHDYATEFNTKVQVSFFLLRMLSYVASSCLVHNPHMLTCLSICYYSHT